MILQEQLGLVLRTLGTVEDAIADEDSDFAPCVPTDWDQWVFQQIAVAIPQMAPEDSPERLWQPILTLGVERHHWVGAFLRSWFLHGFKVEGCRAGFFREWNKMINFVLEGDIWREDAEMAWAHLEDLFLGLFGLDWYCECLKDVGLRPHISSLRDCYRRWAEKWLECHNSGRSFATFLTWPSAQGIAEDGLIWLDEAATNLLAGRRDCVEVEHAMVDCLEHFWRNRSDAVKASAELRTAFMGLLKLLADRMFPRALELQDLVAR